MGFSLMNQKRVCPREKTSAKRESSEFIVTWALLSLAFLIMNNIKGRTVQGALRLTPLAIRTLWPHQRDSFSAGRQK